MNLRLQARYYSTKIMLTAGAILTLVGGLFFVNQALADTAKLVVKAGERLINIYDKGVEKTIVKIGRAHV